MHALLNLTINLVFMYKMLKVDDEFESSLCMFAICKLIQRCTNQKHIHYSLYILNYKTLFLFKLLSH